MSVHVRRNASAPTEQNAASISAARVTLDGMASGPSPAASLLSIDNSCCRSIRTPIRLVVRFSYLPYGNLSVPVSNCHKEAPIAPRHVPGVWGLCPHFKKIAFFPRRVRGEGEAEGRGFPSPFTVACSCTFPQRSALYYRRIVFTIGIRGRVYAC